MTAQPVCQGKKVHRVFEGVGVKSSFKTRIVTGGGGDDYRQTAMPENWAGHRESANKAEAA